MITRRSLLKTLSALPFLPTPWKPVPTTLPISFPAPLLQAARWDVIGRLVAGVTPCPDREVVLTIYNRNTQPSWIPGFLAYYPSVPQIPWGDLVRQVTDTDETVILCWAGTNP